MERKVERVKSRGVQAHNVHAGQVPPLFHEELKVLKNLGRQQLSHRWWDLRSGWKEGSSSIALALPSMGTALSSSCSFFSGLFPPQDEGRH